MEERGGGETCFDGRVSMDREYQLLDWRIIMLSHYEASNGCFASILSSGACGTGGWCRNFHRIASFGRFGSDVKLGGRKGEGADRGAAQSAHVSGQLEIRSRDDGLPNSFGRCKSDSSRLWERDGKGLVRHNKSLLFVVCFYELSTSGRYKEERKKRLTSSPQSAEQTMLTTAVGGGVRYDVEWQDQSLDVVSYHVPDMAS